MRFQLYRYAPGHDEERSKRCVAATVVALRMPISTNDCGLAPLSVRRPTVLPIFGNIVEVAAAREPLCCAWYSVWWGLIEEGARIGKAQAAPSRATLGYHRSYISGIAAQCVRKVASAQLS
jgi:hypothetical protein